jgi:hypothetical protein
MAGHLDVKEAELFVILIEFLAEGEVEQTELRVKVGSHGAELGRPYIRLYNLGLVAERLVRPNIIRWFLGEHEAVYVRLTDKGLRLAAEMFLETTDYPKANEASQEKVPERGLPLRPDIPRGGQDMRSAYSPSPTSSRGNHGNVVAQSRSGLRTTDYTEALGGAPIENEYTVPASSRLDGLAELVGLLGFELTRGGRLLAENRWAEGQSDVEVSLEIFSASLAHAARLKLTGTSDLDMDAVVHLIEAIREMFRPFVRESLLDEQNLTSAMTMMRGFVVGAIALPEVEHYLADPLRGLAPPAICPENIFLLVNVDDD